MPTASKNCSSQGVYGYVSTKVIELDFLKGGASHLTFSKEEPALPWTTKEAPWQGAGGTNFRQGGWAPPIAQLSQLSLWGFLGSCFTDGMPHQSCSVLPESRKEQSLVAYLCVSYLSCISDLKKLRSPSYLWWPPSTVPASLLCFQGSHLYYFPFSSPSPCFLSLQQCSQPSGSPNTCKHLTSWEALRRCLWDCYLAVELLNVGWRVIKKSY